MGEGTLYPALKRLEDKNYLQSYWGSSEGGARRKYYSITEKGRNELTLRLDSWRKINDLINCCIEGDL